MSQQTDSLEYLMANLSDPERVKKARAAGEKQLEELTTDEVNQMKWLAKHNLYYLSKSVLGYKDLSPQLHGHLCSWLERTAEEQFRAVLLPRSHFKSTIVTISDSVQAALPDVDGSSSWPRCLGPDIRVLLVHETHTGAQRFLYEITSHFLGNPKLMALFPECIPDKRHQRINLNELELPRNEYWAEPTFDTMGVGGRAQGRHYNIIKPDDIFGDKARDSKTEAERTIQWFDNLQSFLVALARDKIDMVGTRYSLNDIYQHAFEQYGDRMLKYIRRVEERNEEGVLRPIFPERFTKDSLEILRKNPIVWASQYINDPVAGLAQFEPSWKRFYEWIGENRVAIFSGSSRTVVNVRDCDICILVDPARTGKTGIVVTAVDPENRVIILDKFKGSLTDPEFVNMIFSLVQRWWPRLVGIEDVLFSALYQPWLESEMRLRNVRFKVEPLKRKRLYGVTEAKTDHIRALAVYFSAGLVFMHESQTDLITEFDHFGATDDVHMFDALAYGPQVWRPGTSADQFAMNRSLELQNLEDRDVMTGYSSY